MYADTGDDGIAVYAAGPTPPYATGKITSIAKEGGTWLIWFNGQEAYCCSHGLNGQPKGCPTYSFSHVSRLEPGQYTPGNHYANQVNIWGGLGQLSLDMLDDRPVVASLEDDPEVCEEQPDILGSLYDKTQQWIMENYPDSYAAQTYIAAAEELVNGTDAQSGGNGYYTYIRQMEFLSKNNIDTLAQLETYRQAKLGEIVQLTAERKSLYKTNPDSPRIQQVNTALKQLRQEERLCRKIAEHSLEVQQHLTEARRDRAEQQQREQEHERDRRPNIDLTL